MMRIVTLVFLTVICASVSIAQSSAATTQPSNAATLEVRAQEEFARANWGTALQLLTRVSTQMREANQTDRLGAIEEQIRVCQRNLLASGAIDPANEAAGPATGDDRKPHAPPKDGEVRELTIKDLGNFEYDADIGGGIPADVSALNGATVRITGFMIPMDQADSITQFALVPSLFACCFGQPPQVQHTIVVHLPEGKGAAYFPDEIAVEGKRIGEEKKEDDVIISVFEMEATSVRPAVQ
jgi:hypothetical protein